MLGLLLIFLSIAVCLAVLFWAGGVFLQSYLYTAPNENLYWHAPIAGIVLAAFVTFWCWLILRSPDAGPGHMPYDTIFRFNPTVDMLDRPAEYLRMVPKRGAEIKYKRLSTANGQFSSYEYREEAHPSKHWDSSSVQTVILEHNNEEFRFDLVVKPTGERNYDNRQYVCSKGGWVMTEYREGPDGTPTAFRYSMFLANLILNFGHLAVWIACLWLLLRFLLPHAMLIGLVLWLATTLVMMPMLLSYSGELAQRQRMAAH